MHTYPPVTKNQILFAVDHFLAAFANSKTHPMILLSYFSTTSPISIQHYPSSCSHPQSSLLRGPNAVRSYFDLLATHWTRAALHRRILEVDPSTRTAVIEGSVTWTWKKSGRSWIEEFRCTITFDEVLKITSFSVRTESPPKTCVMRAKDVDESPFSIRISTVEPVSVIIRAPSSVVKYTSDPPRAQGVRYGRVFGLGLACRRGPGERTLNLFTPVLQPHFHVAGTTRCLIWRLYNFQLPRIDNLKIPSTSA